MIATQRRHVDYARPFSKAFTKLDVYSSVAPGDEH